MSIYECRTLPLDRPYAHLILRDSSSPYYENSHEGVCTRIDLFSSAKTISSWKSLYTLSNHYWIAYREDSLRNRVIDFADRLGFFGPCAQLPFRTDYVSNEGITVIRDSGQQSQFLIEGIHTYTNFRVDENAMWEFERLSGKRFGFINLDYSMRVAICDRQNNRDRWSDYFNSLPD